MSFVHDAERELDAHLADIAAPRRARAAGAQPREVGWLYMRISGVCSSC
jgi:hypothetical protein